MSMERSSLRIIHSDFSRLSRSAANNPHSVARRGRRTYKACERCRDQKLRCDVRNTSSDLRCQRCTVHGLECTLDFATPRGRRPRRTCNDGRRRQRRESSAVCQATNPGPAAELIPSRSQHVEGDQDIQGTAQNENSNSPVSPDFTTGLTSQDLRAPVSAVHQMSTPEERVSDAAGLISGSVGGTESFGFLGRMHTAQDVVSSGLIQESQARSLFTLFMACAGNYMPIFDPILDTFDGLRRREPFCFAVILSLACCVEKTPDLSDTLKLQLQEEARRLTSQSLFTKPITLGSVQAMLLLAGYAEEASFAIGHAIQMARDLQIDYALSKLVSGPSLPLKEKRCLMREVRVWLALCYVEREIAAGTATPSRLEGVDTGLLERLRSHPLYGPTELRVTSLVEIVQLREKLQQEVGRPGDQQSTPLEQLISIEAKYCKWFEFWDNLHDEYGFEECSFQRASLRGQKNWALMFTGCAILGRLQKEESARLSAGPLQGSAELIKHIVAAVTDQLRFIIRTTAYRWHLRWATNYTALSVTFAIVFILSIARTHQAIIDREEALRLADEIARILQPYPHPHFYRLIRLLINLTTNRPTSDLESQAQLELGLVQLPDATTVHIPPDLSIETLLNEHLQDADWMLDPSSITSVGLPRDDGMALPGQDLSTMHGFTFPV